MAAVGCLRRVLAGSHDLLALARAWPARYPGLLQSVAHGTAHARHDLLLGFPQNCIRLDADGQVRGGEGVVLGTDFLEVLDRAHAGVRTAEAVSDASADLLFNGGWLLYLGYELVGQIEPRLRLPLAHSHMPVAMALRCPLAFIVDHEADTTTLVAEPGFEQLIDQALLDLHQAPAPTNADVQPLGIVEDEPVRFLDALGKIKDYLRAGDVFQVNLSRGWEINLPEATDAATIYQALRRSNPSPFAALLQGDGWAIASSSPERLVKVRGEHVETRPIAGTRARLAEDDAGMRIRELIGHPKERAEHVMLIDLERNDLGRICKPGSVRVDELMAVESFAHVHHIVSNVSGQIRRGTTPGQVIRAVFPGGTITGCPKVRCMEIIAELEGCARGPYTGALGYLDRNGNLDLNILIRTLLMDGQRVCLRAGAGIVADSDAEAELAETRAKARGLLRAFGLPG
jgi:anthranilate synthase component 1